MKSYRIIYIIGAACFILCIINSCTQNHVDKSTGPLRVSDINPRYFTDNTGKAVYLTGSHTWNNLVDMSPDLQLENFNYPAYIHWMKKSNQNFFRLWAWELLNWDTGANREKDEKTHEVGPQPWVRIGPGNALDGKPKFDLNQLNDEYFHRLKKRVAMAADSGIYASIMLFEGWGLQFSPNAFDNHPFHPENNINGITGDGDGDGMGLEIHTLTNTKIKSIQENYVRKVIVTVNEFDNVLYEISNENHPPSTEWQYHMINFIKEFEKTLPKQHPVGMTFQYKDGNNQDLFDSPAEWISPNPEGGYRDNPPPGDGSKVIITDTDHLWGIGGNKEWVWKSFLRGLNPIFMDPYDCKVLSGSYDSLWVEPLRKNMGYSLMLADRMDLISMKPELGLTSSTYCLANTGSEYLVYLPDSIDVSLNLDQISGTFSVEWFNPGTGEFQESEDINGGSEISFSSPFGTSDVLLYLKKVN
ncbi:DUF6298 domain-containing protein [Bacteroidota bacterium]